MSDRPPVVDFDKPVTSLEAFRAQRQMLQSVASDIRGSIRDVDRFEAEAVRAAGIAAAWAATLMICDILRIGLSAADKRAKAAFSAQDTAIQNANRVLKLLGSRAIATKADLLKSVSIDLENSMQVTEGIRKAMGELRRLKVPTTGQPIAVKVPKEIDLLVDLGIAMAQDTILMLEAGSLQRDASVNAAQRRMEMRQNLTKVLNRIILIDGEIVREFERLQRLANTA